MRPWAGVAGELVLFAALLATFLGARLSFPLSLVGVLLIQAAASALLHCPAHYVVGRALGIEFAKIRLSPASISRSLPGPLRSIASFAVVPSLVTKKGSLRQAGPRRSWEMFMAGVAASNVAVFSIAVWSLASMDVVTAAAALAFALFYLVSDVLFSPKTGDAMRARAALRPAGP